MYSSNKRNGLAPARFRLNGDKTQNTSFLEIRAREDLKVKPSFGPVSNMSFCRCCALATIAVVAWVLFASPAQAQPTIISSVPPLLATGVSPSAPVIFTFSAAMDTNATSAQFGNFSSFPPTLYDTI